MDDAHPSELAGAASRSRMRGEKQNARRVAWVDHRSTNKTLSGRNDLRKFLFLVLPILKLTFDTILLPDLLIL
jgi:hypothetical protein